MHDISRQTPTSPGTQAGNMLVYIIGAIFLLGLLIVLIKGSFQEGTGIEGERVVLKANQVQQYAGELERGVSYVLRNGISEADIRFAAPNALSVYGTYGNDPEMVFAPVGGGVEYREPLPGINDGTQWQFFGTTHIWNIGTNATGNQKPELLAVLPNVTLAFCNQINRNVKQAIDLTQVTDPSSEGCVNATGSEFNTGSLFSSGADVNLLDNDELTNFPASEACVRCSDGTFNYYKVLIGR